MLAPIILFVYNRPWHTQQTVEALQKNELASESMLYVFADGEKFDATEEQKENIAKVRNYIHTISGFKEVHIEEAEQNKGLANSVISGVTKIINRYGKVIVVEDDIVTHPFFLRFMNDALDFYEQDQRMFAVSATMENFIVPVEYKEDLFLTYRFGSWGWASWIDRWEMVDWNINNYTIFKGNRDTKKLIKKLNLGGDDLWPMLNAQKDGKIDSWAVRFGYNMVSFNMFCVRPICSFVANIGMDGSGVHCGNNGVSLLPLYNDSRYLMHFKDNLALSNSVTHNVRKYFEIKKKPNKYVLVREFKRRVKVLLIRCKILNR